MNPVLVNILLILLFIVVGGIFSGAEMALVSLRDAQIRQLSHRGKRGQSVRGRAGHVGLSPSVGRRALAGRRSL